MDDGGRPRERHRGVLDTFEDAVAYGRSASRRLPPSNVAVSSRGVPETPRNPAWNEETINDRGSTCSLLPVADGDPHVGMPRTALFNWAYRATPAGRSSSGLRTPTRHVIRRSPTTLLLHSLRWLGLDWDEGPEVGGDHGLPTVRAGDITATSSRSSTKLATYPCSAPLKNSPAPRDRSAKRAAIRVRRPLPRPDSRGGRGLPCRGPPERHPVPHARSGLDVG